jgi:N-methylhydantoinase A
VLVPIHQGVFSAFGLMTADMRVDESTTAAIRSDLIDLGRVNGVLARLRKRALARLQAEGHKGDAVLEQTIEMRYLGQNYSTDITVPLNGGRLTRADLEDVFGRFHVEHRRLYGYDIPEEIIEFVHFKVAAVGPTEKPRIPVRSRTGEAVLKEERDVYFGELDGWLPTPVYERDSLPVGSLTAGPTVIEEAMSTTLVHPDQTLEVDPYGNFVLHTAAGGAA